MKAYRRLGMGEGEAMPAHRAYYPPLPSYYRDVAFQTIFFRADPRTVREYLPEPLEPDPEGMAMVMSIQVPFCSAYGPFNEIEFSVRCSFRGEPGYYDIILFHDNPRAICAGRERWGVPKVYAERVDIAHRGNLVVTQVVQQGITVATLTSTIHEKARHDEMPPIGHWYDLKIIPRADGPGAALKQLLKAGLGDWESKLLFKGNGMVEFGRSADCDLAPLNPIEIVGAFYEVASYTEVYAEIIYDYLNPGQ
jgi:acetoacetate decarboxylase